MVRLAIVGLVFVCAFLLGGFADQMSPLAQFAVVLGLGLSATFVLPHYFYRGEPLLPDRRQRRQRTP